MFILVPVPFWHQFSSVVQNMHFLVLYRTNLHYSWCKFRIINNLAGTAPYKCAICDEFSEKHQHQCIKKALYLMPNWHVFSADLMYISFGNIVHYDWVKIKLIPCIMKPREPKKIRLKKILTTFYFDYKVLGLNSG